MDICSNDHDEIVYERRYCPMCELKNEIESREKEIEKLEKEIEELNEK